MQRVNSDQQPDFQTFLRNTTADKHEGNHITNLLDYVERRQRVYQALEDASRVTAASGRCLDWKRSAAPLVTPNEGVNPKVTTATHIAPETQCPGGGGGVYRHRIQKGVYGIRSLLLFSCYFGGFNNFFLDFLCSIWWVEILSLLHFFDSRDFSWKNFGPKQNNEKRLKQKKKWMRVVFI